MQNKDKNLVVDPMESLNEELNKVDARASREDLSYDASQLPRESNEDNVRPDRELTGAELERAANAFIEGISSSPIPELTPKNDYWKFVLGSESEDASPSLHTLISRGYTYVRPDECKENCAHLLIKRENDHSGFLRVREMVWLKIPKALHEAGLGELHHDAPARLQSETYAAYINKFGDESKGRNAAYTMGDSKNVSFRDSKTGDLYGFVPGAYERNGIGVPQRFTKPKTWDNLVKKVTQGE